MYNTLTLSPKLIYSLDSCALQVLLILFLTIITKKHDNNAYFACKPSAIFLLFNNKKASIR